MSEFYKHVKRLEYDEKPDYQYLKAIFINQIQLLGYKDFTEITWDWHTHKKTIMTEKFKQEALKRQQIEEEQRIKMMKKKQ